MAPRFSCLSLESKSASRPGRQQLPLPVGKFFRCGRISFSRAIQRIRAEGHPLPAQQPPDTGHGTLDPLDEVVARIQLEHRVDPLPLKEGLDLLCIFLNCFQNRIAGLGLPVPQGEIDAIRPAFRLMGADVLLEPWKPQGAGSRPWGLFLVSEQKPYYRRPTYEGTGRRTGIP